MITKDEAFAFTLLDISEGNSYEDMRFILKDYEEREEYEVCAGIHLAIEVSSFMALTLLVKEQEEIKIELTFDEL
jgi:hypothetical protein